MKKDTKKGSRCSATSYILWGSSIPGRLLSLVLIRRITTQQWNHKDQHLGDTEPVTTMEESWKVAPESRLERPEDLPEEVPFMTEKQGPDYTPTCAKTKK